MKTRTFVDSVVIYAIAGRGGNGCVSFRREKYVPKGGPDGGDGGHGGHVILHADPHTDSLISLYFQPHQHAQDGQHGMGKKMHGRNGHDLRVPVPLGTEVRNAQTDEVLGDLTSPGQEMIVAKGGKGGLGNPHWQTSTHQTPYEHSDGTAGEEFTLRLDLKLMADVGLVGFPNAGKSSIVSRISNAHPKVAPYAFTTINPIIGTVMYDDYSRFTVADIPGLIKGAHEGVGLGARFLRHIERASCLAYVIDMSGSEGRDPLDDYATLRNELKLYNKALLDHPFIVVANKMDLPEAEEHLKAFKRKTKTRPIPVSAETGEGMDELKTRLYRLVRGQ